MHTRKSLIRQLKDIEEHPHYSELARCQRYYMLLRTPVLKSCFTREEIANIHWNYSVTVSGWAERWYQREDAVANAELFMQTAIRQMEIAQQLYENPLYKQMAFNELQGFYLRMNKTRLSHKPAGSPGTERSSEVSKPETG
ncbi:TPA: hypothetical protein G8O00_000919 [Salmonella enterica]|uniref:Uncharacterized protein n=1 Tax=Salmonella enterica TaxID=28901 RepID=A0A747SSN3_SALER|nr:hypothetical protein [Salmonella enterica]HAF4697563.1 hypothetical protein [Salmonella enterica]